MPRRVVVHVIILSFSFKNAIENKVGIIAAINQLLKLAVSSIHNFQSNQECPFKKLFANTFFFTLNCRKDLSNFNSPASTSPTSN